MTIDGSTLNRQVKDSEVAAAQQVKIDNANLAAIIAPLVRDRWKGMLKRNRYSPSDVVAILSNAYGNQMASLMSMFEMMEETWPRLGTNLHEIKTSVIRLEYDIKPHTVKGEKPTASAQDKAKFVEETLFNMRANTVTGQSGFIEMVYDLMDAYAKGLSVMEIDWERGPAGIYRPAGTRWVKAAYYDYPIKQEERERLMLCAAGDGLLLEDFPDDKFLIGRFAWRSGTTAVTQGMLRLLAPWWVYTNFSTEWLMQYAQIFGMPIRIAEYAPGTDMNVISTMLENMGSCAWGAFPQGTTLQLHESGRAAADNPQAYVLARTDEMADYVIKGATLGGSTGGTGGKSLALGEVHERTEEGRVGSCADWVCETITNQLIRSIVRLNYGDDEELPELTRAEGEASPQEKIAVDKVLIVDMGMPVSKEWLYNRYKVPQPADGDELFEPVQPKPEPGATNPDGTPKAKPGAKPAKRETALAAKFAGTDTPDIIVQALERLPASLQEHYFDEIQAQAHFPKGQPGGGRFMSKEAVAACDTVRGVMDKHPALPPNRGRRHISAFGMPDNSEEFGMHNAPSLFDKVTEAVRNVRKTESVAIADLKTTQGTVDAEKVLGMLNSATGKELVHQTPIVIKRGGKQWLWDGHHRAVRDMLLGKTEMAARVVDTDTF